MYNKGEIPSFTFRHLLLIVGGCMPPGTGDGMRNFLLRISQDGRDQLGSYGPTPSCNGKIMVVNRSSQFLQPNW